MHSVLQVIAFFALAFGCAISVWPMLRWGRVGFWLSCCMPVVLLLSPLVIGSQHVKLRALACFMAIELFFKTIDYVAQRRFELCDDQRFSAYLAFLIPFPPLLVRFGQRKREPQVATSWLLTLVAIAVFVLGFVAVWSVNVLKVVQSYFLLDHTIKFVVFVVTIDALGRAIHGLERLAGYKNQPLIDNAVQSRTVGEFWWRYNTRVHGWLEHYIFRPLGGLRHSVRALLATFLFSALFHEFMFGLATSRWDGYQFAFFTLQAPAVIVWRRAEKALPKNASSAAILRGSTVIWMWATSMLFFHGVDRVFPFFYASTPWLP